jgi:hypothetical protein
MTVVESFTGSHPYSYESRKVSFLFFIVANRPEAVSSSLRDYIPEQCSIVPE